MARVARPAGRRGRTIPAALRPTRGTRSDARLPPPRSPDRGHWGRSTVPGVTRADVPVERTDTVRRTAAMITAGALILLVGCSGDDDGGGATKDTAAEPAAAAQLVVAPAD